MQLVVKIGELKTQVDKCDSKLESLNMFNSKLQTRLIGEITSATLEVKSGNYRIENQKARRRFECFPINLTPRRLIILFMVGVFLFYARASWQTFVSFFEETKYSTLLLPTY